MCLWVGPVQRAEEAEEDCKDRLAANLRICSRIQCVLSCSECSTITTTIEFYHTFEILPSCVINVFFVVFSIILVCHCTKQFRRLTISSAPYRYISFHWLRLRSRTELYKVRYRKKNRYTSTVHIQNHTFICHDTQLVLQTLPYDEEPSVNRPKTRHTTRFTLLDKHEISQLGRITIPRASPPLPPAPPVVPWMDGAPKSQQYRQMSSSSE